MQWCNSRDTNGKIEIYRPKRRMLKRVANDGEFSFYLCKFVRFQNKNTSEHSNNFHGVASQVKHKYCMSTHGQNEGDQPPAQLRRSPCQCKVWRWRCPRRALRQPPWKLDNAHAIFGSVRQSSSTTYHQQKINHAKNRSINYHVGYISLPAICSCPSYRQFLTCVDVGVVWTIEAR